MDGYDRPYKDVSGHTQSSVFVGWATIKEVKMRFLLTTPYKGRQHPDSRVFCHLSIEIVTSSKPKQISRFIRGDHAKLNPRIIRHLIAAIKDYSNYGTIVEWKGTKCQFFL